MKRYHAAGPLALLAVLVLGGCGAGEVSAPDASTLVGTWAVVSIDGNRLPLTETVSDGDGGSCQYRLSRVELRFGGDARYSGLHQSSFTCSGQTETNEQLAAGDYRTSGNRIFTINDEDPAKLEGELEYTFDGKNRLTLRDYTLGFPTTTFKLERR